MISFILDLPKLSEAQQLHLEESLLKVPKVDAFALDDGSGNFSITTESSNRVLRDAVATLFSWASAYPGMTIKMKVVCSDEKSMILGKHSPNDIIYFLASC